jgi:tetratricopeptide (TPR) repeat protein
VSRLALEPPPAHIVAAIPPEIAMISLRTISLAILLGMAPGLASGPVWSMGGTDKAPDPFAKPAQPVDANYADGKKAIDAGNWPAAVVALTKAVGNDPKNADAFNYLGYAYRQQYDQAFANYQKALAIDPEHKGAHEYIGEAYLETSNLAKAEEHLKALDKICLFSCKEYTELKARVAEFKTKKSS